ncbi:hypothetical protein CYMTET_37974 [Cymbomonas tetramitiformis]|uniref:Uncharacterized protein n=1 Tax=Cymbomonas tetramitiformis TaxID=36881 RepID=A0AAE0CD03_9CHLO|nr:hypothetical protein CYMTET_37974 [Cymbomonas tetramitiformis]
MLAKEARRTELRTRLCSEFLSCLDTTTEGVTPAVSGAPPSPIPSQAGEDGDYPYGQGEGEDLEEEAEALLEYFQSEESAQFEICAYGEIPGVAI